MYHIGETIGCFTRKSFRYIYQNSKTSELLNDERSLLYLMSDLYIVDDIIAELRKS